MIGDFKSRFVPLGDVVNRAWAGIRDEDNYKESLHELREMFH
jgi:hypothetical protein